MQKTKKEFGIEFQSDIISYILKDTNFLVIIRKYLSKDFFNSKYIRKIYLFINGYIEKNNVLPDKTVLLHNFKDDRITYKLCKRICDKTVIQEKYLQEQLQEYFRRKIFVKYFNNSAKLFNENKLVEAEDVMSKGIERIKLIDLDTDKYEFLFKDFDKRLFERQLRRDSSDDFVIPTGIPRLDSCLHKGLRNGEVGLLIGDAKGSKSTGLRYFGLSAVRRYYNVLHIQLEDSKQKCLDSYDATLLRQSYHDVLNSKVPPEVLKQAYKEIRQRKKKDLIIKAFPDWDTCTIKDIDDIWYDLYCQGIFCHLVIIDYMDLIKARRNYTEERFRQTSIAKDLKSFAIKRNCAVWTATQTHRGIENERPDFVITEKNVAEDYGKIRAVDIPISINATSEELDNNFARIHVCRGRVIKGGYTFKMVQELDKGLFYVNKKV